MCQIHECHALHKKDLKTVRLDTRLKKSDAKPEVELPEMAVITKGEEEFFSRFSFNMLRAMKHSYFDSTIEIVEHCSWQMKMKIHMHPPLAAAVTHKIHLRSKGY